MIALVLSAVAQCTRDHCMHAPSQQSRAVDHRLMITLSISEARLSHSEVAIAVGDEDSASGDYSVQPVWLSANKISLLDEDHRIIATGEELNDNNFAQSLLKKQFKDIQGLIYF